MALLDSETKDALAARIVKMLSQRLETVPLSHQAVRAGVDEFDVQLDATEQAILAALSSPAASWLTANPAIAREIVVLVETARKESL